MGNLLYLKLKLIWYRERKKPTNQPKQRTSVRSKWTPASLELEGVLREHWSDPLGDGGEPKVNGKSRQMQDQKQEVLTSA